MNFSSKRFAQNLYAIDLQSVQHAIQILLTVRDLFPVFVEEFETAVTSNERDGFFNRYLVPIEVRLVGVTSLVENGHANLGTGRHGARCRVFPHEILHISGTVGASGVGTEANLDGRQHCRFAAAILSVNEIDVAVQLDAEFAVAHEVLAV